MNHAHSSPSHKHKAMKAAALWFKKQPMVMQIGSVVCIGAIMGLISIALFQLFALVFLSIGLFARKTPVHDDEKGSFMDKVDMNEKNIQVSEDGFDTPLPGYQTNGYAPVQRDEKN